MSTLYRESEVAVLFGLVLLVLGALEFGHRLSRSLPVGDAQFSRVAAPILALVGLVLAFSYSMADERLNARRAALVEEANSIGTFWLRTGLLPEPTRAAMRSRVRRYVDVHLEHRAAGIDEARLAQLDQESRRLQTELWRLLMDEASRAPENQALLLVTPALNEMIDDAEGALDAMDNRLPDALLIFLFSLVAVAGFISGYGPRSERRNFVLWGTLALVLGGVLAILLDLDRPRRGFIRTDMTAYQRLSESIRAD